MKDIREIDDRYLEYAEAKEVKRKKHKYSKLSGKGGFSSKVIAFSLASVVAIDVGSTAISNEIKGEEGPGFFGNVISQMTEKKVEPEIVSLTAEYSKKQVFVYYDISRNDADMITGITVSILDRAYAAEIDENGHGCVVLDLEEGPGIYEINLTVDYILKSNKSITRVINVEKPEVTPPIVDSYHATYENDVLKFSGKILENDGEILKVSVSMSDVEYELTKVDDEWVYTQEIILQNAEYKTCLNVLYELDGEEHTIPYEDNFIVNFLKPEFSVRGSYMSPTPTEGGMGVKVEGKVKNNDGKVTRAQLRFSWIEYDYRDDGSRVEVSSDPVSYDIILDANGSFFFEHPDYNNEFCKDLRVVFTYTFRGKTETETRYIRI